MINTNKSHFFNLFEQAGESWEHIFRLPDFFAFVQMCDRAAQAAAKQNIANANSVGGQAGANAGQDRGLLAPAFRNDINNPTGYTANQENAQLTAAEAGSGGATSSLMGGVGLEANRTRNAGATSALLDTLARGKQQAAAGAGEKIASDSSKLAQQKRQAALGGVQGMYGQDVGQQMKAMGLSDEAVNSEVNAGKSGWLQNVEGGLNTAAKFV